MMKRFLTTLIVLFFLVGVVFAGATSKSRAKAILEQIQYVRGLWSEFTQGALSADAWWWDEYEQLKIHLYNEQFGTAYNQTTKLIDDIDYFLEILRQERQEYLEGGDWVPRLNWGTRYSQADYDYDYVLLSDILEQCNNYIKPFYNDFIEAVNWNSTRIMETFMRLQTFLSTGLDLREDPLLEDWGESIYTLFTDLEDSWSELTKEFENVPAFELEKNTTGMSFYIPESFFVSQDILQCFIRIKDGYVSINEGMEWQGYLKEITLQILPNEKQGYDKDELIIILNDYIENDTTISKRNEELIDCNSSYLNVGYYCNTIFYTGRLGNFETKVPSYYAIYLNDNTLYLLSVVDFEKDNEMLRIARSVKLP